MPDFDQSRSQPSVIVWFKVYCGVLCFIYLCLAASSLFFFLAPPSELEMSPMAARITGVAVLVSGLLFFAICFVPFVVPPRPWVWVYGICLIALGMTSACFVPACVPLLIFWLKPEVKSYFGKT